MNAIYCVSAYEKDPGEALILSIPVPWPIFHTAANDVWADSIKITEELAETLYKKHGLVLSLDKMDYCVEREG